MFKGTIYFEIFNYQTYSFKINSKFAFRDENDFIDLI